MEEGPKVTAQATDVELESPFPQAVRCQPSALAKAWPSHGKVRFGTFQGAVLGQTTGSLQGTALAQCLP